MNTASWRPKRRTSTCSKLPWISWFCNEGLSFAVMSTPIHAWNADAGRVPLCLILVRLLRKGVGAGRLVECVVLAGRSLCSSGS